MHLFLTCNLIHFGLLFDTLGSPIEHLLSLASDTVDTASGSLGRRHGCHLTCYLIETQSAIFVAALQLLLMIHV